jgi:hypothetical protein
VKRKKGGYSDGYEEINHFGNRFDGINQFFDSQLG